MVLVVSRSGLSPAALLPTLCGPVDHECALPETKKPRPAAVVPRAGAPSGRSAPELDTGRDSAVVLHEQDDDDHHPGRRPAFGQGVSPVWQWQPQGGWGYG